MCVAKSAVLEESVQKQSLEFWRERVSIILIPRAKNNVKRWEARRWWFAAAGAATCLAIVLAVVGAGYGVHYWKAYQHTEALRLDNIGYDQERAMLLSRVSELESIVERSERLVARLESDAGVHAPEEITHAIGPISESLEYQETPKVDAHAFHLDTDGHAKLARTVEEIYEAADEVETRLHHVATVRKQRHAFWASLPTEWPVRGWVTSGFGPRRANRVGGTRDHQGVDIAAPVGTPVLASGDGVVTFAGVKGGYGRTLIVDHGFGMTTLYAHNSELLVKEGDRVQRGTPVAKIGMTGRTTGAHLHYEVAVDGAQVDPLRYLAARR